MSGSVIEAEDTIHLGRSEARIVRRRSLRLLGSVLRPVRWRVVLLMLVVVIAQGARAVGPLLIAIAVNQALPLVTRGHTGPLFLVGAAYLTAAVTAALLIWYSVRLTAWLSQTALLELRRRVFLHVQRLSLGFHERYTSGRTIARQTSDLEALRELLDSGVNQLLNSFVYMAFIATLLTLLDPLSGLVLLVAAVPVAILTRWFHRQSQLHYRSTRVASAHLIVHFVETMTGIRAVQAFRRGRDEGRKHSQLNDAYRDAETRAVGLNGVYDPGLVLIGNLAVAAVLALDGWRVLNGEIPVGTLIAAVLYTKRFFTPVEQMARFYNALQAAVASLEKISGLLEHRSDVEQAAHPQPYAQPSGRIQVRSVVFGYGQGPVQFEDLSLDIPVGQTVALVGPTGAGKSTIAKLIARFYDVREGAVQLDGIDVRDLSFADLRRAVVVVTQEAFLFSGSVADNIAIGKAGATRAEIEAAARAVGAHDAISALPEGYDTDVNKRGGRLSAGQRQLVSFARAFLAAPAVLILDEASSSLDLPSEAVVQSGLSALLEGRTAIIIAHRLSTVDIVDRVLVIDHGRIVEDGSPSDLVAQGGTYAQMRRQWDLSTR